MSDARSSSAPAELPDQELLQKHIPLLRYDPQDLFRVIAAESMVENPGNVLLDADGETIAQAAPASAGGLAHPPPSLSLALLARYEGRRQPSEERLAQAPGRTADARRMQALDHPFARRMYGRVHRCADGSAWLQYWLFYYYNPKNLRGLGKHEGDWEMVQVHIGQDGQPDRVTYAQHEFGEARSWQEIESHGDRPIVYVGQLSHASYFSRGSYPYAVLRRYLPLGIDHALGGESPGQPPGPEEPSPALEILPETGWPLWPGRWGSGERALLLVGRIGDGPGSPGRQEPKWSDPQAFHQAQQGVGRLRRLVGRLTHLLGELTFPRPPRLDSAELAGDELVVSYTGRSSGLRRTKYLLLTVNEAEGAQLVLAGRTVRTPARSGEERFRLPRLAGPLRVWGSAFNGPRQRSELASREVLADALARSG